MENQTNQYSLQIMVQWIHWRLLQQISALDPEIGKKLAVSDDTKLDQLTLEIATLHHQKPTPNIVKLQHHFNLSWFEVQIIWLCLAVEVNPELAMLCSILQQDPELTYPTFALAMSLLEEANWQALSPNAPLRHWHLIHVTRQGAKPLMHCPLQLDERLIYYLQGLEITETRLQAYTLTLPDTAEMLVLPHSQQQHIDTATHYLAQRYTQTQNLAEPTVIQLVGSDTISKQTVAQRIAKQMGIRLYHLQLPLVPHQATEFLDWVRLWNRERRLSPLGLYIDIEQVEPQSTDEPSDRSYQHRLVRLLYYCEGLCFVDTYTALKKLPQRTLTLDVRKPTTSEQMQAWQSVLQDDSTTNVADVAMQLGAQFNFNLSTIHTISQTTASTLSTGIALHHSSLWETCLIHSRAAIDELAERIVPKARWDDIVLPDAERQVLWLIGEQVRRQGAIYEQWGFRNKSSRGLGMTVLFAGESGTGKTMAAEVLASYLNLNLYRIDLSSMISKYIGETEKNLRKVFDAADEGGMILFFDEADALFGKRSEVRSSHDRYANIEVNYLLQRIEAFQGLAILATNFKSSLDDAFTRRIRFSVTFSKPDTVRLERIWQQAFPPETPCDGLDYSYLASRFKLTGGSIANIALNAAFMAHVDESPVGMTHVMRAIYLEELKGGRMVNEADFIWTDT
ncbi:MAG: AAA family ATPase [Chloroflexota bacterium]